MSSRIVRQSKYRHVFGTLAKKEDQYDGVKVSKSAWDSNKVTVNTKCIAVIWDAGGGGSFAVLNQEKNKGKIGQVPLVCGHTADVLDIEFNPFNESLIASASEDGYAKIWSIPENGLTENLVTPAQTLGGHKRKVGTVNFNPVANNILATSSTDFSVKVWDIEQGQSIIDFSGHGDIIQSVAWNYNGSLLGSSSKDKKIRVFDPRQNKVALETEGHAGPKGARITFLGNKDKFFSVGFSKTSERQFSIWDFRNTSDAAVTQNIDTSAGMMMPFYDNDNTILYLAGKGDGNIRYYEVVDEDPYIFFLSEYKSSTPQRGMGVLPKIAVDVSKCEVARLYKVAANTIEPISFCVPRKSDVFQDDIYPDTSSPEPALTASQWISGKNAEPLKISLAPGFQAPTRPSTEFNPVVQAQPTLPKPEDLAKEYEKLKNRVNYLEAEIIKKDARIRELESK
jgi:coronin-1B/1C/6